MCSIVETGPITCPLMRPLYLKGFPGGSEDKVSVYNVRDLDSIPTLARFPGEENGNPLQYSCLENPMDRGTGCRLLSMVAQRLKHLPPMWETQVRSLGREDPLEKEMVTHSSILAWRIPWMEKPGRLQSMGSQRVGHD